MSLKEHLTYFSEKIGPRGSTTEKEKEAAEYSKRIFETLGCKPVIQKFKSAVSAWYPYAVFSFSFVLSETIYLATENKTLLILISVLSLMSIISIIMELSFRNNLFRTFLPKGESQNIICKIKPNGEIRNKVVVLGHIDTHRSPFIFSTAGRTKFFQKLVPLGFSSSLLLLIIYTLSIFKQIIFFKWFSLIPSLFLLLIFILTIQADFTEYSPGANDNATGASIILSLAQKIRENPLNQTEVWLVNSGCEEVGCYGADALAKEYQEELKDCYWIAVDGVGTLDSNPTYITQETFLFTTKSDKELLKKIKEISEKNPELELKEASFRGAYTEGAIGGKYGFKVLTFMSFAKTGELGEWHRPTDTLDRVDIKTVEKTEKAVFELIKSIDNEE